MVISTLTKSFRKVFGSRNQRLVKTYFRRVEQVNAFEDEIRALTDAELKAQTAAIRAEVADGRPPVQVIPRALAVAREAMDRAVGIRNIFNPDHGFDRNELPEVVRPRYDNVMEAISRTEPADELGCAEPVPGWQQVDVPNSIYDAVRELHPQSRPPFRARPFDVQLIGGMVLSEGLIAEMKTGEGKTIVAPLACFLACLEGLQCYVVTVNDYLVQRDRDWVFPFYYHLGLTVGAIHPFHMMPPQAKADAYRCNVVYGTNSEFGFDYLRDNMQLSIEEQVQKHRHFCIIDEVDSILIDEARTPLIISGPAHDDAPRYGVADSIARHLMQKQKSWHAADAKVQEAQMRIKGLEGDIRNAREKTKVPAMRDQLKEEQDRLPQIEQERDRHVQYYELEMERKAAHLTHEGIAEAQKQADIGSFYVGNNMDFPHLLENALRAHAVYSRDKDYVVQDGEVVIVDEFTGRLMIGRQWSDGLHQAVEAKERVKIKQETQTLATVTIQNYFKLFDRLAGMTGTAITEATEFNEIYKLDVICIPTNVSVQRDDRNDLIFLSQNDKWNAILDEIKHHHDLGRPVLVGTTSVEKSEALSQKLTKRHGIKHEVLNAKIDQVEREANIVQHAGELGAVMIATNMAGRGTDIRLAPLDRAALIRHWQQRNVMPRGASPEQSDEELRAMAMRHLAGNELDLAARDLEEMDDEQVSLALLRHWAVQQAWVEDDKVGAMSTEQCMAALDGVPSFMMHRLDLWRHVQDMGGLHIVGTERHEARRIDNQLRGRAGRQGDLGSSRFFIALDDDLMQLFAKGWLMRALPKLGMKEGDALEHRMVTRAVERAQRKVEERNYEIRKNLLEYDEVMEHQRNSFYAIRQEVLQGHEIEQIIFAHIADAVVDACGLYLDRDYVATQVAEWCRQSLDVSIEPGRLRLDDLESVQRQVRNEARSEAAQAVEVELGEYMSNEIPPEEWDLRSLSARAMSRFSVDLKQNQLRRMSPEEVREQLVAAALEQIDKRDLGGLAKFMDAHYAERDLAEWSHQKFGLDLEPASLAPEPSEKADDTITRVAGIVHDKAVDSYRRREITYPAEFILEMYYQAAQQDPQWAAQQLIEWANRRYEMGWSVEAIAEKTPEQLYEALLGAAEPWHRNGRIESVVDKALTQHGTDAGALATWARERFARKIELDELEPLDEQELRDALVREGRAMLRTELAQLERFVLLQILDMAWKDHLYSMDQLKDSVGLRGYAEKDPRIEYKREGARQFAEMQKTICDRVTELIFRVKLTPNVEARSVYGNQEASHAEADDISGGAAGTQQQREDLDAAQHAGDQQQAHQSRRARRAAAARATSEGGAKRSGGPHRPQRKRKRR